MDGTGTGSEYANQQLSAGQVHFHRDTVAALVAENERLRAEVEHDSHVRMERDVLVVEVERLRGEIALCPWEHNEPDPAPIQEKPLQ
jgi:hypothetical protein